MSSVATFSNIAGTKIVAFHAILGQTPRIVGASLLAYFAGKFNKSRWCSHAVTYAVVSFLKPVEGEEYERLLR